MTPRETPGEVVQLDAEEYRRLVAVLTSAAQTLDNALAELPTSHKVYGDLSRVGNWVHAARGRLQRAASPTPSQDPASAAASAPRLADRALRGGTPAPDSTAAAEAASAPRPAPRLAAATDRDLHRWSSLKEGGQLIRPPAR